MNIAHRPRWHVDYLRLTAEPEEVWLLEQDSRREHSWADHVAKIDVRAEPVLGFGCSDCTCATHLLRFSERPVFGRFASMMRKRFPQDGPLRRFRLDPSS
jgi:Uri superfamily endonuclease